MSTAATPDRGGWISHAPLQSGKLPRVRTPLVARLTLGLLLLTGCPEDPAPPAGLVDTDSGAGSATCQQDDDCPADERCVAGVCDARMTPDAGEAAAPDAGAGPGRVTVTPERLDFGAVAFGTSTERTVTITNVGDGPLEILTVFIEDDATSEFSSRVGAGLPETLEPQQPLIVRVSR